MIMFLLLPLFLPNSYAGSKIRGADLLPEYRIKTEAVPAPDLPGLKAADAQLTNGVIINNQRVVPDTWNYYSITVPAGTRNLNFTITNATGDIDIYVHAGSKPDLDNYDCAPQTDSGNETCVMGDPTTGVWWLGVYGYDAVTVTFSVKATFSTIPVIRRITPSAGSGGTISPTTVQSVTHGTTKTFTVTPNTGYIAGMGGNCGGSLSGNLYPTDPIVDDCTVVANFSTPIQLTSGVILNNQSVALDAWKYYKITVPAGTRSLIFATTNATGDIDIYARPGTIPNEEPYVCVPYTDSGNETCELGNPVTGVWWLGVYGWNSGNFSVTAITSTEPIHRHVTPSVTGSGTISPATVQTVLYNATATFTLTPATGNIVGVGGTCGGTLSGNTYVTKPIIEHCTVVASFSPVIQLTSGVILNNQSVTLGAWKYYKITVPTGMRSLTFVTTNATDDVDIYVRRGNIPDEA